MMMTLLNGNAGKNWQGNRVCHSNEILVDTNYNTWQCNDLRFPHIYTNHFFLLTDMSSCINIKWKVNVNTLNVICIHINGLAVVIKLSTINVQWYES